MKRIFGRLVIDVGANAGGYTSDYLAHGACRVIAIEPSPNLAERLRQRFASDPVTVLQCGLSDTPGKLEGVSFFNCWTLARPGELKGRIANPSPDGLVAEPKLFDVELDVLDGLVGQLDQYGIVGDPAFVKIDADGYEPQILRGAAQTLQECRPDILLELSYLPHELGESVPNFLAGIYNAGYTLATFDGRVVSREIVLDHFPWHTSFDMLMVPVERYGWPELVL